MNFLEVGHHLGGEKPDIIVVTRPEVDCIEFLLEVTDFENCLGFANIHHFAKEDDPGIEWLAHFPVDEREIYLVSEE